MFNLLKTNLAVWISVATASTLVATILIFTLAMSPVIAVHALTAEPAAVSLFDAHVANDDIAQPTVGPHCQVVHLCAVAIMPDNGTYIVRLIGALSHSGVANYRPSGAAYLLFHPPRDLSQV